MWILILQHGNAAVPRAIINDYDFVADVVDGFINRFEAAFEKVPGVPVDDYD